MQRIEFVDVMKGILIIFVVIGHTNVRPFGFDMFWFHMPAFFMVSGFLTRQFLSFNDRERLLRKAKQFFIPYISWCILLFLIFREDSILKYIARVLLGGRMNITAWTYPYWFIFSLFWALLVLGSLKNVAKRIKKRYCKKALAVWGEDIFVFSVILLIWSILHALCFWGVKIVSPWGLDCALGAVCYLYVGDSFKQYKYKKWHVVFIIIPVLIHIFLIYCGYTYKINMGSIVYDHWILDLVIPIVCFFALYQLSILIARLHVLGFLFSIIGRCTLTIYFVHAAILHGCENLLPIQLNILLAIIFGTVLHLLFEQFKVTKFLFLQK